VPLHALLYSKYFLYFPDKKTATIAIKSTEWFENQPALELQTHKKPSRANARALQNNIQNII
jgi:hypothetical protein